VLLDGAPEMLARGAQASSERLTDHSRRRHARRTARRTV
jgi:hypothetical protein